MKKGITILLFLCVTSLSFSQARFGDIRGGDFVDDVTFQSPNHLIHQALAARQSLFDTNSELHRILIAHIDDIIRNTTDPVLAMDMRERRQLYIAYISLRNWDFSQLNTNNLRQQFDVISRAIERHNRERVSMTEEARRERIMAEHQATRTRMETAHQQREQARREELRRQQNSTFWGTIVTIALVVVLALAVDL